MVPMVTPFEWLAQQLPSIAARMGDLPVTSSVQPQQVRSFLAEHFDLEQSTPLLEALPAVSSMLERWTTHVTHPRYFGNFNPSVTDGGVIGEALAAAWNPQLAVWCHAPAAVEIERFTLDFLMGKLGLDAESCLAHFTGGGSEANHTAVICALTQCFPQWAEQGAAGCEGAPRLYVSAGAHDSFFKIAHAVGIGRAAVRIVPVDGDLQMDVTALRKMVIEDARAGCTPFMVVATAGSTAAGTIDPLKRLVAFGRVQGMWVHVDAAYGGFGVLTERLRPHLDGIAFADSITFDAHKGMSVPMGAGMFFCRHPKPVEAAFAAANSYMPAPTAGGSEPYLNTLQWSRRFIGLKVFLSLVEHGARGYDTLLEGQCAVADVLIQGLIDGGWQILSQSPLPMVCFSHQDVRASLEAHENLAAAVRKRGQAWISAVTLADGQPALRACVTSFRTTPADVATLLSEIQACRIGRFGHIS